MNSERDDMLYVLDHSMQRPDRIRDTSECVMNASMDKD